MIEAGAGDAAGPGGRLHMDEAGRFGRVTPFPFNLARCRHRVAGAAVIAHVAGDDLEFGAAASLQLILPRHFDGGFGRF